MKLCWFLQLPGLAALYHLVQSAPELQSEPEVYLSDQETKLAKAFEVLNGYTMEANRQYRLNPINSMGVLAHWRIVLNLMKRLASEQRKCVRTLMEPTDRYGCPRCFLKNDPRMVRPCPAADCHFHLDKLQHRLGSCDWEMTRSLMPTRTPDVILEFLVTCYAFPETWPQ